MQPSNLMLVLIISIVSACGSRGSDNSTPIQTQRSGQTLSNVDIKYTDVSPTISNNALKMAFVSGRNADKSLRVFTMTRTALAVAFANVTQLSVSTGLVSEEFATISPDGNFILVEGNTATGRALVLCNFSGTTCTTATTIPWQVSHSYGFSPDSALFYYLSGTKTAGGSLNVATVAAPTTAATIGTANHWTGAFWMPTASGYQIVATENATSPGKVNFVAHTFASQGAATSAAASTLISNLAFYNSASPSLIDPGPKLLSGAASRFFVKTGVVPTAANAVTELGNYTAADQKKFPVLSEFHTYTSTGTDEGALALTGYNVLQAYIAADSDTIFSLNSVIGRCAGEDYSKGSTLVVSSKASKASTPIFLKRADSDKSIVPTVATDFCDRTVNNVGGRTDLTIRSFTVNAGATASAYTLIWTAASTANQDSTTADSEIYVLDLVGGTKTVTAAAPNYAPNP